MSAFLPEGSKTPSLQSPGVAQPTNPEVTDEDLKLMQRVLTAASQYPNMIPDQFMSYLVDFVQTSGLIIPIGQVFGFSQFTAGFSNFANGSSSTSSSVYGDLPDGLGPAFDPGSVNFASPLADGHYAVLYGAFAHVGNVATVAQMKVQANGTLSTNSAATNSTVGTSIMAADIITLAAGGANSLVAKYQSTDNVNAATFAQRWILVFKYGNL